MSKLISHTRSVAAGAAFVLALVGVAPAAVTHIEGTPIKKVYAKIGTDGTNATESYALLPGASRKITIPAGGDMVLVTFSAECRRRGDTESDVNWIEVSIRDNNTTLAPTGDGLAFCSGNGYVSQSTRVAQRLAAGEHTLQVFFKIRRGSGPGTLTGWLDDWVLTILQSD